MDALNWYYYDLRYCSIVTISFYEPNEYQLFIEISLLSLTVSNVNVTVIFNSLMNIIKDFLYLTYSQVDVSNLSY
jgi:hypothetical protein